MTAITVSGLRISPYTQKDLIPKLVFGDQWGITIKLPTPHQAGDKYALGIDYENTLYPPNRPLCAGTEAFAIDGDELTFNVKLGTARLRDWVSSIRKPMPIAIQIVRIRSNKAETILLDTLLALPSVFDGVVTVCEGDAIQILLDAKLDKPAVEGVAGQILGIDENGQTVWVNEQEIPEQQQANWDESDSGDVTYIKNKPQLAKVATSGSYNDLTDKPTIPEQKQANWNESDSTDPSYIENKPNLATVATTGDYNDLSNKPDLSVYVEKAEGKGLSTNDFTDAEKSKLEGIESGAQANVNANWDESDSTNDAFIKNKPTIPTVNDATVTINQGGVEKGTFTLNQSGNTTIDLNDGAQSDWDESDSTEPSYIENKPDIGQMIADALVFHNN